MLIVISPAKSLDYQSPVPVVKASQPDFLDRSEVLIARLREKSPAEIAHLMALSDRLAALNVVRYAEWSRPFTARNARPAVFAFDGDVYDGLDARHMDPAQIGFAQVHLRILSGLYGLLRPLDLMQAYRLEMGTKLANPAGRDLYAFWGDTLARALRTTLDGQGGEPVLVNLASEEYFRAVPRKKFGARIVTPVFEERRSVGYRVVSFHAKRARGLMSRFAIVNAIDRVDALKAFADEGYVFSAAASQMDRWVFRREA